MPQYLAPGVYIEEIKGGSNPISNVSTTTAAFLGVAPKKNAFVNEPRACNNYSEFQRAFTTDGAKPTHLVNAVRGFYENGGTRCFIVNTGSSGDEKVLAGIQACEAVDEISMLAAPGYTSPVVYNALLDSCERLGDRFAILDGPSRVEQVGDLTEVAAVDTAPKGEASKKKSKGLRPRVTDGGYGAFYFPWLAMPQTDGSIAEVPPSGHMAGVYAMNDFQRGVHKAPANYPVRAAVGLTQQVTRAQQEVLNPAGVNVIRFFGNRGIRVWGARTLADQASEWRYVPVRRTFNLIEESIAQGTDWIVFEPNDMTLWKSVTRDITAYLMLQWRAGALMGATPQEAFFVTCNAETNPPESIDQGMLIALIGIAPVKPAEFIIFRITQKQSGATVEMAAQ